MNAPSVAALGLAAILASVATPIPSLADVTHFDAWLTATEISPTEVVITTDLPGGFQSPRTIQLTPGYDPPGTQYALGAGPYYNAGDTGGIDSAGGSPGEIGTGDTTYIASPYEPPGLTTVFSWIAPESTPGNTLYDTIDFEGFEYSIAFATNNELPSFGGASVSACFNDSSVRVACPVSPYGTVYHTNYYNGSFNYSGALTVSFVDEVTPEPRYAPVLLLGLGCVAIASRRRQFLRRMKTASLWPRI